MRSFCLTHFLPFIKDWFFFFKWVHNIGMVLLLIILEYTSLWRLTVLVVYNRLAQVLVKRCFLAFQRSAWFKFRRKNIIFWSSMLMNSYHYTIDVCNIPFVLQRKYLLKHFGKFRFKKCKIKTKWKNIFPEKQFHPFQLYNQEKNKNEMENHRVVKKKKK